MADSRTPEQVMGILGSSCFPIDRNGGMRLSTRNTAKSELRTWTVGFRTFRPSHQPVAHV